MALGRLQARTLLVVNMEMMKIMQKAMSTNPIRSESNSYCSPDDSRKLQMHLMVKNDEPVITRPPLEYKKMHLKVNKQIKYEKNIYSPKNIYPGKIFTPEKYSPSKKKSAVSIMSMSTMSTSTMSMYVCH